MSEVSRAERSARAELAELEQMRRTIQATAPSAPLTEINRAIERARDAVLDSRLGPIPPPDLGAGTRASLTLLAAAGGGDLLEHVAALLSQGRRAETTSSEAQQRSRAMEVDLQLDQQHRALERAQEAAEDSGFWDTFGEVACWVGAAAAVVAAIPSGGATLALAGVAAAAAISSQYAPEIAEGMCDAGIISRSTRDDWALGLSIGCAVVALGCGIGGAVAGASAAASQVSNIERGARTAAQVAQTAAGVAQGVSTGGGAVCAREEANARVDAERADHEAEVAQEQRDELIDLIQASARGWCRELQRIGEMIRTVHETSTLALATTRA